MHLSYLPSVVFKLLKKSFDWDCYGLWVPESHARARWIQRTVFLPKLAKTYCTPEPPLKGEKWGRATDFILRSDAQEKDHHRSTPVAQTHQATATEALVAATQIKPIPKPCLLKAHFNADHPQSVNNRNVDYVVPASDPTCSDGKNNDTHLGNWHIHPKTTSHKSKRLPPSIPLPARPLPKESEQLISMPSEFGQRLTLHRLRISLSTCLKGVQRIPTMLPLPGLVDKLIESPSKRDSNCMCHLYEVVTSEQTYHQSLTVAVEHFQESSVLKDALAPRDRKSLFSSISVEQDCTLNKIQCRKHSDVILSCVHCHTLCSSAPFQHCVRCLLTSDNILKMAAPTFLCSVIESVLCSSITVWFGLATKSDIRRRQRMVRTAERIIEMNKETSKIAQKLICYVMLDQFEVQDYVHRSLIEVTDGKDLEEELEGCELNWIFQLALLHNHRSTTSQLLLQTNSEAEKDLWVDLLGGRRDGQDTVYEDWEGKISPKSSNQNAALASGHSSPTTTVGRVTRLELKKYQAKNKRLGCVYV
ncbi:unnamed protein product [Leuciscus chuanchicus]